MAARTIAVYGARGHTARFVARELQARGLHPVLVGRHAPDDARAAQWRTASCDDPDSLDRALDGAGALINCAGPFADTAPALVEAALRCRVHYLDLAAEQRSVRQTLATYHEDARRAGVVLLPAMAFYGGLADLLATLAVRAAGEVESIDIGVGLDSWHPTAGTRRTGERNSARRLIVTDGRLAPLAGTVGAARWQFAAPMGCEPVQAVPLSEIILIHKHIGARGVQSFMNLAPLKDLGDPGTPPPVAVAGEGRSAQRFMVDVVVRAQRSTTRLLARGQDIYAVSAHLAVEACERILRFAPARGGAFAPGELFDASDFLAALAGHLEVERLDDPVALQAA